MSANLARLAAVLGLSLALAACAVTSIDGRRMRVGSDDFRDYVESVFLRQNALAEDLGQALEAADPDSDRYQRLDDAELGLLRACGSLNELAQRARVGDSVGGLGALKRARRAPECERAVNRGLAALL
jgi:hypothetical protein